MMRRVVAFADDYGLPQLLRHLPRGRLVAVVAAAIRPQQHAVLESLAAREAVPLVVQPKREAQEYGQFVDALRATKPDFAIVNSYSMKLWPETLALFPRGGINVHGGLLPYYRGANPIQWALIHDERQTGVTMHVLAEDIDAGAIIAQRRVPVAFEDTWVNVQARIATATEALLAESLAAALAGSASAIAQDEARARTFPRRRPEDGRFDWSWRVLDIHNLVRALVHPHPGAFYEEEGTRQVFDQYLTVSEITALKFGRPSAHPQAPGDLVLRPHADAKSNADVLFATPEGPAGVTRIDWGARAGELLIPAKLPHLDKVLREFATGELGVEVR